MDIRLIFRSYFHTIKTDAGTQTVSRGEEWFRSMVNGDPERQIRRVANPLYDLTVAARRVFWVAACAGVIVFGSLMGAMFIGQQFLQNVLGYSPLDAGAAILPAVVGMVIIAPRSA